ncbi:MAG: NINE protein [Candidatus Acidiferrales bacterium]
MNAAAVCPYCRGPIEPESEQQKVCEGCGTPHHSDCYEENGGCTVFGCSFAPAEEPELSISRTDLANATRTAAPTVLVAPTTLGLGLSRPAAVEIAPAAPPVRVKTPPPPLPQSAAPVATAAPAPLATPRRLSTFGAPSVLFGTQPEPEPTPTPTPALASASTSAPTAVASPYAEFAADAKNRTTFIVLGVLLGFTGAHNFYAAYKKKAIIQLCITVLTLGFAAPMIWVWAVIDVCTVDRDSNGTKFAQ